MNKIQKPPRPRISDVVFFIILCTIIIVSFVTLSPKISTQLFSFKREAILNEFIHKIQKNGLNPQEYWKFREFYSPGYFNFSKDGINNPLLKQTKEKVGVKYNGVNIDLTFLIFSSPRVNSLDMLTSKTDLSKIIDQSKLSKRNILFMEKNTLIYREDTGNIKIAFLLSNNEMKKANGFFDYRDMDKKITEGENWFNITSIKTD